jgi:hypothetical protein
MFVKGVTAYAKSPSPMPCPLAKVPRVVKLIVCSQFYLAWSPTQQRPYALDRRIMPFAALHSVLCNTELEAFVLLVRGKLFIEHN